MILAGNPKYWPRMSEEEKARRKIVRDALRPGLVLEFIESDYHEDEATPSGFHEIGDRLELVRVIETKPIVRRGTNEQVGESHVWLAKSSRWGESKHHAFYLEGMTKLADVSEHR